MRELTNSRVARSYSVPPKSVHDMTPAELQEIDKFQNRNRGWVDDGNERAKKPYGYFRKQEDER